MTLPIDRGRLADRREDAVKSTRLRALLASPRLEFIMEAHDGLSAKIVEEAGFEGIWASGLAISAALGVRDSNEASWTQVLEVLEFMSDASRVPILLDGDTGYGNFNNVRRVVRKLGQRGIAGICIEDKLFPKTNSFLGDAQPLADVGEFCGKIKAAKDSQLDDDFCVVARCEALISGRTMNEALERAEAYREAGADGILIHSKQRTGDEVLEFLRRWDRRCPVVLVPTSYYRTPVSEFEAAGASLVIWANHNLRASITAMRETSRQIQREQSLVGVEERVAPMKDVFALTDNDELEAAEARYLPTSSVQAGAVILAASRGAELGALTEDRPKCMVDVRGRPLLHRLVEIFREGGIGDVTVVRGYGKDMVNLSTARMVDHDAYDQGGEAATLAAAADAIDGDTLISYGDILFRHHIVDEVLEAEGDIVVVVDALWRDRPLAEGTVRDLVTASEPFAHDYLGDEPVYLKRIGNDLDPAEVSGEWIGLARVTGKGAQAVRRELDRLRAEGTLDRASLPDLLDRLVRGGEDVRVLYVAGQWLDVDDYADLSAARKFV